MPVSLCLRTCDRAQHHRSTATATVYIRLVTLCTATPAHSTRRPDVCVTADRRSHDSTPPQSHIPPSPLSRPPNPVPWPDPTRRRNPRTSSTTSVLIVGHRHTLRRRAYEARRGEQSETKQPPQVSLTPAPCFGRKRSAVIQPDSVEGAGPSSCLQRRRDGALTRFSQISRRKSVRLHGRRSGLGAVLRAATTGTGSADNVGASGRLGARRRFAARRGIRRSGRRQFRV